MSLMNIVALTVLMCFGTYEFVQGEYLYGVDLPRPNITAMSGKWYLVASPNENDNQSCVTNTVAQVSPDKFTMTTVTIDKDGNHNPYLDFQLDATMTRGTNIISTRVYGEKGPSIAIFDVDYGSYMAAYMSRRAGTIPDMNGGFIYILARGKTVPEEIFERIKNSRFYIEAKKIIPRLQIIDTSVCE